MADEINVLVATKAFGMGVDKADISRVVRIGCPKTLEDMLQEFGRAGRGGHQSEGTNIHLHRPVYIVESVTVCILFSCSAVS